MSFVKIDLFFSYTIINMNKIVFVFNKFYTSFIKDLKKEDGLRDPIKKAYKAIDKMSAEYVEFVLEQFEGKFVEPDVEKQILKGITVTQALEAIKSDDDKEVFWNYYYVLATLALVYNEFKTNEDETAVGVLAENVLSILNKKQKGEDISEDVAVILQDDVLALIEKIKQVKIETKAAGPSSSSSSENPFMSAFEGMENSKICNLAKEISNDIDVSGIKADSPEDIMKLLDFTSSNNIMGDIIKKVSSKMHEKISAGELKQEDLFGEAMSMMSKMNFGGGGGGGGGMGGLGGLAGLFNNPMMGEMMKMAKKNKVQPKQDAFKTASSRDRLRKKLEERRNASPK